jgi:phage gp46-like protein
MKLGEITAAMATHEALRWAIDDESVTAVPSKLERLPSGRYSLTVRKQDGTEHILILCHYAKSILTHPLEYDLR